jgi:uncharacterized membrane protein
VIPAHPGGPHNRAMSTEPQFQARGRRDPDDDVSGWAVGGTVFAATVLMLIGVFQAIAGLVAIFDDNFYVVARNYTFDLDVTAWGWIHLLIGILLVIVAYGLFARSTWAGVTAIMLAGLSAVANFFFIPYYPAWAILVIALDIWVIWSLTRPGVIRT